MSTLQQIPLKSSPTTRSNSPARSNFLELFGLLVKVPERPILKALPDQFANVFVNWTDDPTNYIAVLATYTFDNAIEYKQVLQWIPPREQNHTGRHRTFSYVLYW